MNNRSEQKRGTNNIGVVFLSCDRSFQGITIPSFFAVSIGHLLQDKCCRQYGLTFFSLLIHSENCVQSGEDSVDGLNEVSCSSFYLISAMINQHKMIESSRMTQKQSTYWHCIWDLYKVYPNV